MKLARRTLLGGAASAAALTLAGPLRAAPAFARVRPGQPGWPTAAMWEGLGKQVGGRLTALASPWEAARTGGAAPLFAKLRNPYAIGDDPALTQTLGWTDAWTSQPSAWVVAARDARDVAAAVDFARTHRLRLVVKGGGHSYQGTSNAPDSLLVWTRAMRDITLHDGFVPQGGEGRIAPQQAVSVGAGAMWGQVYAAVCAKAGRYVQGGGCLTVGVAGLIQSGGFGSLSKAFGSAASSLIEAEVVTADGRARIVNAGQDPELYWALKGGGGGSFGIVTRLTLRTHPLPATVGAAQFDVTANSDAAWRALVARVMDLYADTLFSPHWGEQLRFRTRRRLQVGMVSQGLDDATSAAPWRPLLDWIAANPADYTLPGKPLLLTIPARSFWDPAFLRRVPGVVIADDRPGASPSNVFWSGNQEEAGQVLHAYHSAWLPARLLNDRARLVDALVEASSHWQVALHCNKGLAGAPVEAMAATRDTATNPQATEAFALLICASEEPPAYPGVPGHEPNVAEGREEAAAIARAMAVIDRLAPGAGSYVSESDYFERDWARSFWGDHYPRLRAAKERYDPQGLFFVHHGVGSENWSADGFTRLA